MGFGFNLFLIFILIPLIGILLILFGITKNKFFGKSIGFIIIGILSLMVISGISQWIKSKKVLTKEDYYGEYIINRDFFKGKQSDWQYENYRFKITEKDSILFFVMQQGKVLKTYKGKIKTVNPYGSERIVIEMEKPTIHILETNPTIYRSSCDFYLVFNSAKFKNMYFKKGEWKPLQ